MTAAAMDEMFRVFRNFGMSEKHAGEAARVIPHRDEVVTHADRESERDAARAVREAERAADREAFAAKNDVTVLQTKVKTVEDAIISIDKRFERIDATIVEIKETSARTDEKINALQTQNKVFVIPLLFATLGALFGVIGLLIRLLMVSGA